MRARTWATIIVVNLAVTGLVVLGVLLVWNRREQNHHPEEVLATPLLQASPEASGRTPEPATAVAEAENTPHAEEPAALTQYTVQSGDTLSAIAQEYGVTIEELMIANGLADPNVLAVGQVLAIPAGAQVPEAAAPAETAEPAAEPAAGPATPLPTPTSIGPPIVEINEVQNAGSLADELITVRNRGGTAQMDQWVLADAEGNVFIIPALTLFPGGEVRIHTAQGSNQPTDLYWGRLSPAWSTGELVTLRDAAGTVVDTYVVPENSTSQP